MIHDDSPPECSDRITLRICTMDFQPVRHHAKSCTTELRHGMIEDRVAVLSARYARGEPLFRAGEKFPPDNEYEPLQADEEVDE